jgi:AraC-like DNA-binding protein
MDPHAAEQRGLCEPAPVRRAREYLFANLADNVPLADLAAVAGVGTFRLLRAFRKVHGVPPHRYQLAQRIERAKRLIREGGGPLSAIAFETGFADQSHLTRNFKRWAGVTPLAYARAVARERAQVG